MCLFVAWDCWSCILNSSIHQPAGSEQEAGAMDHLMNIPDSGKKFFLVAGGLQYADLQG
jgi:hypothetical protein